MRIVENSELSNYKVLPFDLYTENRTKVLEAGEVLTPGKLIMLKNYVRIYTEDFRVSDKVSENTEETSSDASSSKKRTKVLNFSYESLDPSDFETVINRDSWLDIESQVKIKYFYKRILDLMKNDYFEEGVSKLQSLVNVLKNEIYKKGNKAAKGSRVRFMGEYELCHPLNVATVAGLMAKKLEYSPRHVDELLLAALLHDVGKLKIKLEGESSLISLNEEELKQHTIIGYKLIKDTMGLSENIAKVAFEHHENNDGSGYPKGISNDFIHPYSQIVNVANYYDNLAFNRTHILVTNNKEALRTMLEVGTKRFSAEMLYTFIHMFNYDDLNDFNDLIV
ncbi:HD domain-containing protein [bacterium]|nr:HD domain-containing protein [bacterium]